MTDGIGVTGFADDSQKIVFLHNPTNGAGRVDLGGIADGMHVSVRTLTPADSPHSPWFDESARMRGRITSPIRPPGWSTT